jgi:small-conductance mechanosensitive channel
MAEEWSPDKEFDPAKLQAEYLELLKEIVEDHKAEKAKKLAVEQEAKEDLAKLASPPVIGIGAYRRPTFQELSARMKRAWEETQKIAQDAPQAVQVAIFQNLINADDDDGFGIGEAIGGGTGELI